MKIKGLFRAIFAVFGVTAIALKINIEDQKSHNITRVMGLLLVQAENVLP